LSGGLDSSSIVTTVDLIAPIEKRSVQAQLKTFSSCFEDPRFDEREYIEEVLKKTQAEPNYVFPQPNEFLAEIDNLLWHQEEPFRGSGIYAQWCVMRRARERGAIVMLDGQGGDELLCGYRKFHIFYLTELFKRRRLIRLLSETSSFVSSPEILETLNIRHGLRYVGVGRRLQNVQSLLRPDFQKRFSERVWELGYDGGLSHRIKADLTQFSLPVLLRYEDKNSMAHSVEARLPFLDYRLVEAIASFPLDQKIRHGWTKYVLRKALKGILPEKIRLRKSKLGFVTPEEEWFKHTLSDRVKDTFSKAQFLAEYIEVSKLQQRYERYRAGLTPDTSEFFFRFFILELWGQRFMLRVKN
jgi:asparagine synthase (glutamine-hydrolysing)